jgi:hypothetical protein
MKNLKYYMDKFLKRQPFLQSQTTVFHSSPSRQFTGTDTEEAFTNNLDTQSKNWYYRKNPVHYKLNSSNYRTTEFKDIDWSESVVVFGCSNVFGLGLDEEDTITNCLSKLISRPVINMGVSSSSMYFSLNNSVILNEYYPTPKGIVQLWTNTDRITYYRKSKIDHLGRWILEGTKSEKSGFYGAWALDEENVKTNALFAQMISRQLWKDRCGYYEATFFEGTAKTLKCDLFKRLDSARDLMHPGRKTAEQAAIKIAKNLKL